MLSIDISCSHQPTTSVQYPQHLHLHCQPSCGCCFVFVFLILSLPLVHSCCCFVCPLYLPITAQTLQIHQLHHQPTPSTPPAVSGLHTGDISSSPQGRRPSLRKISLQSLKHQRLSAKTQLSHIICCNKHYPYRLHFSLLIEIPIED